MNKLHVACAHCGALNRIPDSRLADAPNCGRCKRPVFNAAPLELTPANFDNLAQRSDLPLLIDFWAAWCGPCQMMAPVFEQAARRLEPRIRLAKLNTEQWPDLAGRFNIRSIPTLVMLHRGREIARQSGAMPLEALLGWAGSHAPRLAEPA